MSQETQVAQPTEDVVTPRVTERKEHKEPRPVDKPDFHILSDAELARRGKRVTLVGVAALLVASLLCLWGAESTKVESTHSGPMRIVAPGSSSDAPVGLATPVSGGAAAVVAAPTPTTPAPRKPIIPSGGGSKYDL